MNGGRSSRKEKGKNMATVVDSLFITLGLDSSGVSKGMNDAQSKIASGVSSITRNVLAPLMTAFASSQAMSNFVRTADEFGKLSANLRADVNDVQAWSDAVEASGGSASALQGSLSGLEETLRAAQFGAGSSELRQLGILTRDANGNLKTSVDILDELANASQRIRPEKFERLAKSLGFDAATIRFLQQGRMEVDSLVNKYKDLAYTKEDADIARKFNVAIGDLAKTFRVFAVSAMRVIVPALTAIADTFAGIVDFLRRHGPFVKASLIGLALLITGILAPALMTLMELFWALLAPVLPWILLIGTLALIFDDLIGFVRGADSAIERLLRSLGFGDKTIEKFRGAISTAFEGIKAFFSAIVSAPEYIILAWTKVKEFFEGLFSWFSEKFQWFAEKAKPIIDWFNSDIRLEEVEYPTDMMEAWGMHVPDAVREGNYASSTSASTTINGGINVYTDSNEPKVIGNTVVNSIEHETRRITAAGNRAMNQ